MRKGISMDFIALDFETANHNRSSACQIGLAKVINDKIVETRCFFIKPVPNYYEPINIRVHGITEKLTDNAPSFEELWQSKLSQYIQGYQLVAHNAPFEKSIFNALKAYFDLETPQIYDTLRLSRALCPELLNYRLDSVCEFFSIPLDNHHDAEADAVGCAEVLLALAAKADEHSLERLYEKSYYPCYGQNKQASDSFFFETDCFQADEDLVKGKTFCFTGKLSFIRRDIASKVIEQAGGYFKTSLSSKVDYLVVGDLSFLGDESEKLRKVREYREKGYPIEILTEQQFQEMVVYEGKHITEEMIAADSEAFLSSNQCNLLYGKNVCVSEGFNREIWRRLSHLGISSGVSFWADEAGSTDFFIISNSVLEDLKKGYKSPLVIRMENALNKQANPDGNPDNHHIKFIDENTILSYLSMIDDYVQGKGKMKVHPNEEPHLIGQ